MAGVGNGGEAWAANSGVPAKMIFMGTERLERSRDRGPLGRRPRIRR